MSSLLALVRYRNSGAFSVEAKIYGFWLLRKHPNFLIARGVPPCLGPWGWGEKFMTPWDCMEPRPWGAGGGGALFRAFVDNIFSGQQILFILKKLL